ncbi:SDR family oxidoreductase [Nostoc sp. 'Lobaria pulmonaria (5183) cyanobiont']|uniref:SDR family oxidoreductase n=1 Tax=Nostoc sp. 'Lobaria pulmonaria (5183) cyanobiont' TaxID=1618022 RepID=UPI000CF3215A|nr:SDR family NAD(P)-dependent oxidoreductase [Nostoc sp. 'Lobaria pulmonaria (5183) cyanobiont']AVH69893.1 short-chain dehydrogenase/reductase SDR [Nostoc sp. 'Lobaria pulmonaria (5183) cyanobiont']
METLIDQVAVVTGASSGIGRAIALALAAQGVQLCLLGRNLETLQIVAAIAKETSPKVVCYAIDLIVDKDISKLQTSIEEDFEQVDLLILSAGMFSMGTFQKSSVQDFDLLYQTNVRAPYLLTQTLLPMLLSSRGQILFINSSVIMSPRANVGQFSATQHALKAIADTLRVEVNADQVRIMSVFPGRTATPRQAIIHEMEGKPYYPERLMQPEDVAAVVINALSLPRTVEVTDINLRPFVKP